MKTPFKLTCLALLMLLSACGSPTPISGVKVGKPYAIDGKMYYPEYDPTYDETGVASWYGPGFHGKYTANGEVYDQHALTAAHPTLPMPSLVRVTNLENGKNVIVRINDRGPFAHGRIIDLSKHAAGELDIKGIKKVRVQYLKAETEAMVAKLPGKASKQFDVAKLNYEKKMGRDASILASTQPDEDAEIIESTVARSDVGETISEAAPIMSVSENSIDNQQSKSTNKGSGFGIIRKAYAEEPITEDRPEIITASGEHKYLDVGKPSSAKSPPLKELSPAAGSSGHYIQVGAFSSQDNAKSLARRLADIGGSSIGQVESNGKNWWRVRLGPFVNSEQAQDALTQVRKTVPDARIIHL